jgi:hypothetical protein
MKVMMLPCPKKLTEEKSGQGKKLIIVPEFKLKLVQVKGPQYPPAEIVYHRTSWEA